MPLRSLAIAAFTAVFAPLASSQFQAFEVAPESMNAAFYHQGGYGTGGTGGGAAWFDLDGDLDEDLFVIDGHGEHAVLRWDDGVFTDVGEQSGLQDDSYTAAYISVNAADYDQDGWVDLYLTQHGPNSLFTNLADGSFRDDAQVLGVQGDSLVRSMSAAWADFDVDGDLDLYVGNYIYLLNFPYHVGEPNQLYVNEGTSNAPQFVDRAVDLGVDNSAVFGPSVPGYPFESPEGLETAGCTLSIYTLDYDEDGDPDLMVGNDFGEFVVSDHQYRNDLAGGVLGFTDVSEQTGMSWVGIYDMGINGADYDHDGDWDIYKTNIGVNHLLRNDDGVFTQVSEAAGPDETWNDEETLMLSSWGTVWADFDNDRWEDLFVVNGYIPAASFILNDNFSPNHLWMNQADGTFSRYEPELSGLDDPGAGRGVAECDVNRDGWMDIYLVNNGAFGGGPGVGGGGFGAQDLPCNLFLNQLGQLHPNRHWLELWLHGRRSNTEALGARVHVEVGGEVQRRQVLADSIYASSRSKVVHAGLGKSKQADRVRVWWPSGIYQELLGQRGDLLVHLYEPRVSIQELGEPFLVRNQLHMPIVLQSWSTEDVEVGGSAVVRVAATGKLVAQGPAWTELEPSETAERVLVVELPPMAQGVELELVARIECDYGVDMRALTFTVGP